MSRFRCPPGPLLLGIDELLAVDGVADVTLERADGFPLGLALCHLPLEVGRPSESVWRIWQMATMWMAWLSDGCPAGQPMDDPATR